MARRKNVRTPAPAAKPAAGAATAPATAAPAAPVEESGSRASRWLIPLLIVGAGLAAYWNSFAGAFLFDDTQAVTGSTIIRQLWPLWPVIANTSRPLVSLSLAINYAVGGLDPFGYHLFNLAVHLLAGLTLYGIARRMLTSAPLRPRFGDAAPWLAGAIALVWTVHPLQTQAVTYVVQRAESMMGLFFLLTLYCAIRGAASPQPRRWYAAAIVASALGMGSKEVMVVAPVMVLLYDRLFLAPSFRDIARQRWGLYAGLAATWLVLAYGLATNRDSEQVMLVTDLTRWRYALTQPEVIVHYLRLAFWPSPLVLDYGWQLTDSLAAALPWAAIIAALVAATLYALHRRWWVGFWGAWFFLILAPTSSIVPIADIAFEHRMYLPLAALAVLAVLGAHQGLAWLQRRTGASSTVRAVAERGLLAVAAVALVATTVQRNEDYRTEVAFWTDNVAKRPENPRPRSNLGRALVDARRLDEAVTQLNEALRLWPDFRDAHNNLGVALNAQGNTSEAIAHLTEAIRLKPRAWSAYHNLGNSLYAENRLDEAAENYRKAIRLKPDHPGTRVNFGNTLLKQGKRAEAIAQYNEALRLDWRDVTAHNMLGAALFADGKTDAAIDHYAKALVTDPNFGPAEHNLGIALSSRGRKKEAIVHLEHAAKLTPDDAIVRNSLGGALAADGRTADAITQFTEALRLDPKYADARSNLAKALGQEGRTAEAEAQLAEVRRSRPDDAAARNARGNELAREGKLDTAVREYEEALRIDPGYAPAERNLAAVLHRQGKTKEAIAHLERAVKLDPNDAPAHNNLGAALAAAGRMDEAIVHFSAAVRLKPDFPEARDNLRRAQGK